MPLNKPNQTIKLCANLVIPESVARDDVENILIIN